MTRCTAGLLAAITAVLLVGPAGAQKKSDADTMLEAARQKETLQGDLNAAIKQYGVIAAKYAKTDCGVTAAALVRMADCYRKMGDAESRKIYERVVREYADQKEAVALARAGLGNTGTAARKTTRLLWSGPKVGIDGRVSADGRYLSYTDWDSGDLAVHEIATGQDRRLTDTKNPKTGNWNTFAEASAVSKDGKQVAYGWFDENNGDRYELRLASLTGDTNPRRLYDNPASEWLAPRDWSPDGKWVAVVISLKDGSEQIALISVPDGSFRLLKAGKWRGNCGMFFSPDSKYLGYDLPRGDAGPGRDVFVIALDGASEIPAVISRGRNYVVGWSPDGKQLLFSSDRSGSMALWSLPFTDGQPQGAPELIMAGLGLVEPLGMARSGVLHYGIQTGNPGPSVQVASFDFATGKLLSPPRDVNPDYVESNFSPDWSPDGKHLAYISRRRASSDSNFLVIRSAEDFHVVRELQPKLIYYLLAGWAPDSLSLVATGRGLDGRMGTFRIDAQSGDVSLLALVDPKQPMPSNPVWSADGKSIYYKRSSADGKEDAFIQRDLASGSEKELVNRPNLGAVNLSPDGRYVATASTDPSTNSRTMLLIPLGGGESRHVMRVASEVEPAELKNFAKGQGVSGVIWAPDSRSFLTFKRFEDKNKDPEIWRVPVDGGAPRKLEGTPDKFVAGGLRLHPDGRRIVRAVNDPGPRSTMEVWVLENFLATPSAKK